MDGCRRRGGGRGGDGDSTHPSGNESSAEGSNLRHPRPPETLPLRRPLLPLLDPRHLLEIRYSAAVQVHGGVHRRGAAALPEVRREEPAQRAARRRRLGVLLVALLRHAYGGPDGEVE